jgi:hypothetical protein
MQCNTMNNKLPFIEAYLEEYDNYKKLKDISNRNKCKIIPFSQVEEDTKLNEYDYIIIVGEIERCQMTRNMTIYNKCKNKLFFIGDNEQLFNNSDEIIYRKIKSGIVIDMYKTRKNIKISPDMIQMICITDMKKLSGDRISPKFYHDNLMKKNNALSKMFDHLTSSIKIIDIKISVNYLILLNNLPNSVQIIKQSNCYNEIKRKLPFNVILIINSKYNVNIKSIKNMYNMKAAFLIMTVNEKINEYNKNKYSKKTFLIKEGKESKLINKYSKVSSHNGKYYPEIECRVQIKNEKYHKYAWLILSYNFINNGFICDYDTHYNPIGTLKTIHTFNNKINLDIICDKIEHVRNDTSNFKNKLNISK